jgi:hypothetical protein
LKKTGSLQITELHFYTADTLGRLERYPEAEAEFLEELKFYPQNVRARGGLAMLYQAGGKPDAAAGVIAEMLKASPTPESYALASRLLTMFGEKKEAETLRAEARRTFADAPRSRARGVAR